MTNSPSAFESASKYLSSGWHLFLKHWQILIVIAAIPVVLDFVILATIFPQVREYILNSQADSLDAILDNLPPNFLTYMVINVIVNLLAAAAFMWSMIRIVRDKKSVKYSEAGQAAIDYFWDILVMALIVGLAIVAGLFALVVPGVIIGFLLMFAIHARLDMGYSYFECLKLSYRTVTSRWASALLMALIILSVIVTFEVVWSFLGSPVSRDLSGTLYGIFSIPISVILSLVFTVGYFDMKVALKDSRK